MKKETLYYLLIMFIIYLLFKKSLDVLIDFKYPVFQPEKINDFWKGIIKINDYLTMFTFVYAMILLYFLRNTNNIYLKTIITLYGFYPISYFLIDKGNIWNFISKTDMREKVANFIDIYFNSFLNLFSALYCFYAISYIFLKET